MENDLVYLLFQGWYRILGEEVSKYKHHEIKWFYIRDKKKLCAFCGERVTHKDRSVDHIIPISVCRELGWLQLEWDKRNLRIAHQRCNELRAVDISDLPPEVLAAIERRRLELTHGN